MRLRVYLIAFLLLLTLFAPLAQAEMRVNVVTTLQIFSTFVKEVGGDRVDVQYIVPQGMDIHSYSLKYGDVEKIENSDLVVLASSEFFSLDASILEKVQGKEILDFEDYNATIYSLEGMERNIHGYWLYPPNAINIALAVERKLSQLDPSGEEYYRENFLRFKEEVESVMHTVEELSKSFDLYNKTALLAVPGTYYMVKAMGMKIGGSIVRGPNQFISGSEMEEIKREIREGKINLIVNAYGLQDSKAGEIAKQLSQETGVRVVYIDIFSAENYTALLLKDSAILSGAAYTSIYGGENCGCYPYIIALLILSIIIAAAFFEIYLCRKELLR